MLMEKVMLCQKGIDMIRMFGVAAHIFGVEGSHGCAILFSHTDGLGLHVFLSASDVTGLYLWLSDDSATTTITN